MFASRNSWFFATLQPSKRFSRHWGQSAGKDMEMLGLIGAESWAGNVRVGRVGDWIAGRQTKESAAKNGPA